MTDEDHVGRLVARGARGHASLALATVGTTADGIHRSGRQAPPGRALWQIGSITKVFTALVLARAVVRGDVTLETPVRTLLREAPADVTLGRLATHTSGLPRISRDLWLAWLRREQDPYAGVDRDALMASLASARRRPVGRVRYSNLGFGLLGLALATAADTSYDAIVRAEVCEPLGLSDTTATPSADARSRCLPGHTRRLRERAVAWEFDALAGAGALWSSIEDMQAFLRAVLDPPPGELGAAMRLAAETHAPGRGHDQGLGWIRFRRGPVADHLFHNGGTYGFRSALLADPATGRGAVALSSTDRSVDGLVVQVLGAGERPPPTGRPAGATG
ncbi:MAG: Beta-lactamase class C-like and penicillin binding proteins (PBPs) superfamily [uncultured Nocardioides sp.]|uniref:Beta-lactamase class C-like and penicillin binding proteins (PBPs) superfamily n=1 Tax=uncultured Nocardioides sp. TaxID=198441 RepID=A0A6J4MU29_9ACTN|nr:MAG: Beta-lactamase class C-like and penicillin binding proteins (PBPs) superfamily [uncultured Nocardioides sp.]